MNIAMVVMMMMNVIVARMLTKVTMTILVVVASSLKWESCEDYTIKAAARSPYKPFGSQHREIN